MMGLNSKHPLLVAKFLICQEINEVCLVELKEIFEHNKFRDNIFFLSINMVYCDWYIIKVVSQVNRGESDVDLNHNKSYQQLRKMFSLTLLK